MVIATLSVTDQSYSLKISLTSYLISKLLSRDTQRPMPFGANDIKPNVMH